MVNIWSNKAKDVLRGANKWQDNGHEKCGSGKKHQYYCRSPTKQEETISPDRKYEHELC